MVSKYHQPGMNMDVSSFLNIDTNNEQGQFDVSRAVSSLHEAAVRMSSAMTENDVTKALESSPLLQGLQDNPLLKSLSTPSNAGHPQGGMVNNGMGNNGMSNDGNLMPGERISGFPSSSKSSNMPIQPPEGKETQDDKPKSRRYDLEPETEFRVLVEDKLYEPVTIKVCGSTNAREIDDPTKTAEIFGKEMVLEQEYPIFPGSRTGFYSWKGCRIMITGPTVQEFAAHNSVMRDYANVAAIIDRRRQRAIEINQPAPRIMVTGSDGSGKSIVGEILWNYALRKERTPIFVETDPRHTASVSDALKGLPGCVHACIGDFLEEENTKKLTFFLGNINWADHIKLYEQILGKLARVVNKKLSGALDAGSSGGTGAGIAEGPSATTVSKYFGNTSSAKDSGSSLKRVTQSGLILNAPPTPTLEILSYIIREFQIDTVLCLDNQELGNKLGTAFESENLDIVHLDKTDGTFLEDATTLRMQRHQRMKEYFQGVNPTSNWDAAMQANMAKNTLFHYQPLAVYHGSFPLSQINLLQYNTTTVAMFEDASKGLVRHEDRLKTIVFDRALYPQLIHTALGVIRAASEEDLLHAQLAGYIIVTNIDPEKNMIHVAMPDVPPLPSNYFLVPHDIRNMTYIDALQ